MDVNFPLFRIPDSNKKIEKKKGGGSGPKFFIEPNSFEEFKNERVSNLDRVIDSFTKKEPKIKDGGNKVFLEFDFNNKALAKSNQPTTLLDKYNIDIYAQKGIQTFIASVDKQNLINFRNSVIGYNISDKAKESAYLSAITNIHPFKIEKESIKEGDEMLIYFHETLGEQQCKNIYNKLKEECSLSKSEFFISNSGAKIIYSTFNMKLLELISEDHPENPIQKVEKNINIQMSEGNKYEYDFGGFKIIEPELDAIVGVFDSGVEEYGFLKGLIIAREDFINDASLEDKFHGTFVGTRAIFGNDILSQLYENKQLYAQSKIIDIKMMKKDGITEKDLIDIVTKTLEKYSSLCKIYNLSLNLDGEGNHLYALNGRKHFITRELDSLALKYGVLFIISAGNHYVFKTNPYPECLLHNEATITPPADMLNGISVGSIADINSSISLANVNETSPFSRSGAKDTVKPEVCHYGGNIDKYFSFNGLGVKGFGKEENKIDENIGTSFSAPLVSQIGARIYAYLKDTNMWGEEPPIELVKALIIHSANYKLPISSRIDEQEISRMTGFGIPDFNRAINGLQSEATLVYFDSMNKVEEVGGTPITGNKHKIKFDIPSELQGANKKIKIKTTLVYNPPISTSGDIDYSLSDIEVNLHYLNSNGTFKGGELKKGDINVRNERVGLKQFERIYNAYQGGFWEIRLTLKTRGGVEMENFLQKYALIISIEDVSNGEKVNLHEIIKTQYQQYVPIIQNIKVKT